MFRRLMSLLLAVTMVLSMLPATALAEEYTEETVSAEETLAPAETQPATEEATEETTSEPTEAATEPEKEETVPKETVSGETCPPETVAEETLSPETVAEETCGHEGAEDGECILCAEEEYTTFAAAHSHPVCGSRCSCSSSSHSNLTWTAWDGTTKMYNGNYYLTEDIELSSTMILDYSYVSRLCLNGHTITCESMVFDIYSYRTLVVTDCVGTGKIITTNGNYVIGNNRSLTIYGGTLVNTSSGWNSAVLACSNTYTYIYGGRLEGQDMAIYGDLNSKVYIRGGTVAGTDGGYAIYGDGNLTISDGLVTTDGSTAIAYSSGDFTVSGGTIEGYIDVYGDGYTTSISGGTIDGTLFSEHSTIAITGGDIGAIQLYGNVEIRAGTFHGSCGLGGGNIDGSINIYGGNFSDCSYLNLGSGSTWISGGSFSTLLVGSNANLYLSGVPEIQELEINSPGTVSAQSPDGTGSFGGDPIPIQMSYSTASASPWGDGKTVVKNVKSDAVAQKFTLTGHKSEFVYLERSGNDLVLRLLPYGRWNGNEWSILDGVLTISGSGSITSASSGTEYPWYSYADQITAVVVEDGILGIPAYTFEYLENVETIRLPSTLQTLSLNAFQDCGSLNSLVLPASIKTISGTSNTGYPAFIRCESLTDVYYEGTAEEWEVLKAGRRITSADSNMTLHCLELVESTATCTQPGLQAHYRYDDQAFGMYGLDKKPISQLETVPALGHRICAESMVEVDPLRIENTSSVPFSKEGNTYYSQNHTASSSSSLKITVLHDCTLTIQYGVSSESNYDWLTIMYNSTSTLVKISGVVSNQKITKDLTAGDVLVIGYSKDGSYDKNDDRCWATLIYDPVMVEGFQDIPAEDFEPDCENGVVCDYCDTVVKAALGHSMSQWTVSTPASCTENGLKHRTCSRCGDIEEEVIPAGHSFDENHICSVCGTYEQPGGSCGEELDWTLEQSGQLVISGTGGMDGYDGSGEAPWSEDKDLITSIVIGDGVTGIGDGAFRDCENLTTVVLPDGLTSIGDNAFSGCTGLTDINIPDTVTEIGSGAFQNCDSLTSIILPAGITAIGSGAFNGSDSLTDLYFGGTAEQWAQLGADVPETVFVHFSCTDPENHWQAGSKEATCTEAGYTYDCCSCGHRRNIVTTGTALGHDMGDWSVTQDATCTEPGLQRKDCSRCDYYETEAIPMTGHSHEAVVTPPTCTEAGFTTHTCHCGDTYTESPVDALGHDMSGWVVTQDATCTEQGAQRRDCSRCDHFETEAIPMTGHSHEAVVTPPTCTEAGFTTHTCHCGDTYTDTPVDALGHVEVIDEAVPPTCTETGLTEGSHCQRNGEVLIPQEIIPANGHSFAAEEDRILCVACGEELLVSIPQEYAVLNVGKTLTLDVSPAEYAEKVQWTVENDDGTVTTAANVLTAAGVGTAYVTATVTAGEFQSSVRFRVDVTDVPVEGVQLNTTKATTELFSTDYTDLEVLLKLPQNYTLAEQADVQDNGIAIDSARFTNTSLAKLFHISVLDDRRIQIVPTDYAVENPRKVKSKYTGTITVTVHGREYVTGKLTLTVKQTKPKVKATVATFNSFLTGQEKTIKVTGGTATAIYENTAKNTAKTKAIPSWLTLENGTLKLKETAPKKSTSGKCYLLVDTEEWRIPAQVTLSVKNSYKARSLKLSPAAVTLTTLTKESEGVSLKLRSGEKGKTLTDLKVSGIIAPDGYTVEDFNAENGSFLLKATKTPKAGSVTLKVTFHDTAATRSLKLTVKTANVSLKTSVSTLTLNSAVRDSAVIKVTATPADYRITDPTLRLTATEIQNGQTVTVDKLDSGELDIRYENGELSVRTTDLTPEKASYRLYISAGGSKEAVVTVSIISAMPSVTYKAAGSMDLSFPSRSATVTPTFRNYNGGITDYEYTVTELKGSTVVKEDVSDAFTLEQSGKSFRIRCTDAAVSTANTYQLKLRLFLEDSSCVENTINLKVKRTAVKLKLSKTKLTLNKLTGDKGTVTVSCATSGYDFTEPVIILSGSAEGKLDVAYENGRLTVATNKNTQYGKTYRITLKADPYAPSSTLTVTIPTIAKSEVTASLKVSGKIDVIRAGSKATVTPSYKNCLNTAEAEEELIIYNSKKAKVNDLFHIEPNGKGGYTITQAEGARLTAGTYKVKLLATIGDVPVESKQISLTVSMAAPKLTVKTSNTTLFAKDGNDRALVRFVAKDTTLNQVTQVRIKDSKYQDKFEIIACGNGEFAIAFRDGKVHRSLVGKTVTLTLNVFLEGNQTSKANTTAKVKLTIVK